MAITRLEIDLAALRHNYTYLRSKLEPGVRMMAVVKAYGYGSEAQAVALELEKLGVDYFAVAYVSEGVALRDAGIKTPILVLHPQPGNFEEIIERCLEPSIYSTRVMELFSAFAKAKKQSDYPIHLKFNTGLNRLGFSENAVPWIIDRLRENKSVKVKSIFSHLVASEDKAEEAFTLNQILSFTNISKELLEGLDYTPFLHQSNTSAILNYPRAQFDCVRSGIGLYGYGNSNEETAQLQPVARLKSVISQIHNIEPGETVGYNRAFKADDQMTTATIPIGHADGISRIYGNGVGFMTIHGEKAPIIGNVCMDMTMIDITGLDCKEGDEVEIFGNTTNAEELATSAETISYELLTAVGQRVKRVILR